MAIDRKQIEEEFRDAAARGGPPGQQALNGKARPAGAWIKDDYDDKQRAHILETEGQGPDDGLIRTDLIPDMGGDADADEIEDDADHLDGVIDTNKIENGDRDRDPDRG